MGCRQWQWVARASRHLHDVLHALGVDDVATVALRDVGKQHAAAALRHKFLDVVAQPLVLVDVVSLVDHHH